MITYTWKIETIWVKPIQDSLADVVITVAWRCTGSDGTYQSWVYNTCSFLPPSIDSFTSYSNLTEEQVLNWCWQNGVNKSAIETIISKNIDNQINPPIITLPLPWDQ